RVRYEDADVRPGARYGYRLRLGAEVAGETWVTIPARLLLAMGGTRPNPAAGAFDVSFTLPDAAPASLEMLDAAGRRLWVQEVGGLGSGTHVLHVAPHPRLASGLYVLRLTQRGRVAVARACVVR